MDRETRYDMALQEATEAERQRIDFKGILREIIETAVLTLVIFFLVRLAFQNFRIEGHSMLPNLHHGQFLIVNRLVYRLHPPERGDVVVFHSPQNPGKDFIKRVVGLPGEQVEISEGQVFINGTRLDETYINRATYGSWGPAVVSEGDYFVLGDNRDSSSDSRNWGMLDKGAIVGKAWLSYWPPQQWGIVPHYSFAAE